MLSPRDTFERAYGRDELPRAGDEGDEGGPVVRLARRALARVPLRVAVGGFELYWLGSYDLAFAILAANSPGQPTGTIWLPFIPPALAGAITGWWRGTVLGALVGGALGALVFVLNPVLFVLAGPAWLLVGSAIGFVPGLLGAVGAAVYSPDRPWRYVYVVRRGPSCQRSSAPWPSARC
jgi:hypothetical protein